jgi:hypothetical protein
MNVLDASNKRKKFQWRFLKDVAYFTSKHSGFGMLILQEVL